MVFDKTYILIPEYFDELVDLFSGNKMLVAELETALKAWYAPEGKSAPQNINYRVLIAVYILSSLKDRKAPVEFAGKLVGMDAEGIRQLTLLISNERMFPRK